MGFSRNSSNHAASGEVVVTPRNNAADVRASKRATSQERNRLSHLASSIAVSLGALIHWRHLGAPIFDIREASQEKYAALLRWAQENNRRTTPALVRLATENVAMPRGAEEPPPEVAPLEVGLRAEMRRLEQEAAENYRRFKTFENGDPALRTSYHKVWTASVQTLAKIAREVPDHELEEGKVIPVDDIKRAVRMMLGEFRVAMDALPFRLSSLLGGVNDPVERQRIIEREKEHVLQMLREPDWKTKIAGEEVPSDEPTASGGVD